MILSPKLVNLLFGWYPMIILFSFSLLISLQAIFSSPFTITNKNTFFVFAVSQQNLGIRLHFILSLLNNIQETLVLFGFGKVAVVVYVHNWHVGVLLVVGHYLLVVVDLVIALAKGQECDYESY